MISVSFRKLAAKISGGSPRAIQRIRLPAARLAEKPPWFDVVLVSDQFVGNITVPPADTVSLSEAFATSQQSFAGDTVFIGESFQKDVSWVRNESESVAVTDLFEVTMGRLRNLNAQAINEHVMN